MATSAENNTAQNTSNPEFFTTVTAGPREITVPTGLFINGQWRHGADGETLGVTDAATGQEFVRVASATEGDAREAMDHAAKAQPDWENTSPQERADLLRSLYQLVQDNADDLAYLQSLELGRALKDSQGEVGYGGGFFRWYASRAEAIAGEYRVSPDGGSRIITHPKPVGPVLAVTPWNFPLAMITRKLAPALAAGCTMIVKPAQMTPLTALYLAELSRQAGLPEGVFQVLPTSTASNVSAILDDARLRKFTFTGSTEVGQALAAKAAEGTIRTSLELGGNAPLVVLEHADMDKAVNAAIDAKMRGAGQVCIAANRILVHESLAEEFTAAVTKRIGEFVLGAGTDSDATAGPMVSAEQRDKVAEMVEKAVDQGAKVEIGGFKLTEEALAEHPELKTTGELDTNGFWYAPTVLSGVTQDFEIANQEIFGPVMTIQTFADEDEALANANATNFGLAGYVVGEKLQETMAFAEKMEVGMVAVNKGLLSDPAAPFGGVKQSGIGREGGFEGIEEYLETQFITVSY
ncbi:NAD-dependent succinate-semialdehyde dehydrogenase [Corynebacterium urealyticum]|uniref:NAD-dependent succinate-semialdehyde dehydrogenase n=1 Tax=Corynebacterium urealyticum TaxID=43771 RepID=UPI00293E070A|nr:NAD-dependent succinate-semialdehyde dehydrogenase [Corynebacterium urealyticum]WOH94027.1 NAD-dependent succinate-semialdehyde dehydrogenase [Corynebacterium urealyticum]